MLFNSVVFFLFLILIIPLYYVCKNTKTRVWLLLFSSYVFYAYWDWRFCGLLMLSTLTDYWIGLKMFQQESKKKKRSWLWLSLLINRAVVARKFWNCRKVIAVKVFSKIRPWDQDLLPGKVACGISYFCTWNCICQVNIFSFFW